MLYLQISVVQQYAEFPMYNMHIQQYVVPQQLFSVATKYRLGTEFSLDIKFSAGSERL